MESVAQYRNVEKWCRDAVKHNANFIYDAALFHRALHEASTDFGVPFEVRRE